MESSELLYTLLGGYTTAISYDSIGNPEYMGETQPGTSKDNSEWRIFKITYDASNNPTDIKWAGGEALFNKKWNDKTSYNYS